MPGLRRAVREVSAHYATNNVPFIIAGWQKRRRIPGDEASSMKRIHITFMAPKKILETAPRYDPAVVVRPRPTASALASVVVQQHGYMAAIEDNVAAEIIEDEVQGIQEDD